MNKKHSYKFIIACALFNFIMPNASGTIKLDTMENVIKSNENIVLKKISNASDEVLFVKIEVSELKTIAGKVQQIPIIKSKNNKINRDMLVVTPQRLIIPPKSFQNIRIIVPPEMQREVERIYSIQVVPVAPTKKDGFDISDKELNDYNAKKIKAGVQFLIGYAPKVFILPSKPNFNTSISNSKTSINIVNSGNATIILENIKTCIKGEKFNCQYGGQATILPGKNARLEKKISEQISFTLVEDNQKKDLAY